VSLLGAAWGATGPALAQGSRAGAEVKFTHGVLAFLGGDFAAAARFFEEAVLEDPEDGNSLHWLAAAYLRLGRGDDAKARLEKSLGTAVRPPASGHWRVRAELRQVRQSLERGTALPRLPEPPIPWELRFPGEPPRWEGELGLQAGWDSNPGLLAEDLGVPVAGAALGEVPDDAATLVDLRLDHHPLWDRGGWSLGVSLTGHGALHQNLDETDLTLARATASLARGKNRGGFVAGPLGGARLSAGEGRVLLLQGGGLYATFGGEELLRSGEAAAAVSVRAAATSETWLAVAVRARRYAEGAGLRRGDEEEVSVAVDQLLFRGSRERYLRIKLEGGDVRGERSFAAVFGEARIEAGVPLSPRFSLLVHGSGRLDRYDHPQSNVGDPGGPERDDRTWRVGAAAVWRATERLDGIVRGSAVRRDSNVELPAGSPLLDYRRTVLALGLRWRW
jgi:hypothetical protein